MTNRFIVHPLKLAVSLITALASTVIGLCQIWLGRWGSSLPFLTVAALFLAVALTFGAAVTVDRKGVRRRILGRITKEFTWDEIAEVGVTGTKVFNRDTPKKTGSLYVYFSPVPMTEEERFEMTLNWPPRDKIFFLHTEQRMDAVQLLWNSKVQTYNTGDLRF